MLLYLEICELHSSLFIQCLRFFVIQNRVFKSVVPPLTLFIEASHSILIVCCMTSMVIKHCFNWKEWVPSDWSMHPHGNLRLPVLVAYTFQTDKVVVSETTKLASFYFTFLLHCFFFNHRTCRQNQMVKWCDVTLDQCLNKVSEYSLHASQSQSTGWVMNVDSSACRHYGFSII